jgi:hypothetical protein
MRILLAVILFTLASGSFAQDTVNWSSSTVLNAAWPKPPAEQVFQFRATIEVAQRREKIGGTHYLHFTAIPLWLKSESFIADSLSSRYKPLAQLYFDCYELEARKLQETINLPYADLPVEQDIALIQVRNRVAAIKAATNEGQNREQMEYWRTYMDSCLRETPRLFPPNFEQGKFTVDVDAGPGTVLYSGALTDYFTTKAGWGFGLGMTFRRFSIGYRTIHTFTHAKLGFSVPDFKFSDTNRLQINQATWSFGYQVIDRRRWTVMPYVGMATFRIINRDQPKGSLFEKSRASLNVEAGLTSEWRFYHFHQNNAAQFYWKLLLKVGYARVNYLSAITGGSLKFQVGIGWSIRTIVNTRFEY